MNSSRQNESPAGSSSVVESRIPVTSGTTSGRASVRVAVSAPDPEFAQWVRNNCGPDGARAVVVNRTHRVVRQQAMHLRERRGKTRSLWVPLTIVSTLLLVICYALWAMLDGYNLAPNGVPDASDQLALLLLWSLPVTAVVLGAVWFKRGRGRMGQNSEAQP